MDAWNLARLADANIVCLDTVRVVWGPCPRRPPADEDLEAAEEALRQLWREKVAVPAYNYPSYHGHMTYVPWVEWRSSMTPMLDQDCFHDMAAVMERIWASKGKEEETEEDEE